MPADDSKTSVVDTQGTLAAPAIATGGPPAMPGDEPAVVIGSSMPTLAGGALTNLGAPPSMSPARYAIANEIARGGMGRVVEAVDTVLGRVVALKEALAVDPDAVRRFQRETKITARLEHPSIVPVHDAGTMPGGAPYYVMRKIGGRPLETLVAATKTVQERLAFVPQIVAAANAVAHAHHRGIVHRDIKPSNILVGDLGETIVIDWGLAKVIGAPDDLDAGLADVGPAADPEDLVKTRAGIVYGTPGFMAPEQLCGFPVDERVDVYALGATLYHVLSMKPPHHAKTADAMMRAAVEGPPEPIRNVVPGVPPELATIIDKALATDAKKRYQDARALAEDLQRFLTGQLIASHHYTPREKLQRFLKKYRVPVIIAAAATAILAIGAVVAIAGILRERDRADEQARAATARADQIALDQARILIQSNPTLAVALLRPLVDKKWRDVRDIAAAARAAGVAYGMAASPHTPTLELSRDGTHALTAGDDGVVRVLDLAARTAVVVAERHAPAAARFAGGDAAVVVWSGAQLDIVARTPSTIAPRELTAPAAVVDLEVAGAVAFWADADRKLWKLDLADAAAAPIALPLEEGAVGVSTSPDGAHLAVATPEHLLLLDPAHLDAEPAELARGQVKDAAWSGDASYFAWVMQDFLDPTADRVMGLLVEHSAIDNRVTATPRLGVAVTDRIYSMGELGVSSVVQSTATTRAQLAGGKLGLRAARGETLVAHTATNTFRIIAPTGDHTLSIPLADLEGFTAAPTSPYVVAAFPGRVLVWNLDDVQPARVAMGNEPPKFLGFAGTGRALADGTWAALPAAPVALAGGDVHAVAASPDGAHAIVVDTAGHARADGKDLADVVVTHAGFYDATHALVGTQTGLASYDAATGALTPIAPGAPEQIAWTRDGSGWIAATFAPARLWRRSATLAATTIDVPVKRSTPPTILPDGTVVFGVDRTAWAWRPSGALEPIVALAKPLADFAPGAQPGIVFAFATDGSLVTLDTRSGTVSPAFAVGAGSAAMAADASLLVARGRGGEIELVDPVARASWALGDGGDAYGAPAIAPDGKHVLVAVTDLFRKRIELPSSFVVMFAVELPADAAGTRALLDRLTNAQVGTDNTLTWK